MANEFFKSQFLDCELLKFYKFFAAQKKIRPSDIFFQLIPGLGIP
jgi:hypothetical protein